MKNKNKIILSLFIVALTTTLTVAIPVIAKAPTNSHSLQLPCARSLTFEPYLVDYIRGTMGQNLSIQFTRTVGDQDAGCMMNLHVYNAEGEELSSVNLNNIFTISSSTLNIDTNAFEKAFDEDGAYTIKFKDNHGNLIDGVLAINTTSGAVLGAYQERVDSSDSIKLINLIFYAILFMGAFYLYKAKKLSVDR